MSTNVVLQVTGLCMMSLRRLKTKDMEKRNKLNECEDFPKGKSEAMHYTRCWHTFFNKVSPFFGHMNIWCLLYHLQLLAFLIMVFIYIHLMSLYKEQGQILTERSHLSSQICPDLKNSLNSQK